MKPNKQKRTPESTPADRKPDMKFENKKNKGKTLKEETQNNLQKDPKEPKTTTPNNPGKVKNSPRPSVAGAMKPEATNPATNSYPHKMKALEEKLFERVLERILQEVRSKKQSKK